MKISTQWLDQYVSVADIAPNDLADRLTMAGLEVEALHFRHDFLKDVVVGKIAAVNPHPRADRLQLCTVNAGNRMLTVVCGAPNVRVGMKAPCALPGAVLPGGLAVRQTVIREIVSEGMLCGEAELQLGPDASGLMALNDELPEGTPLNRALGLWDAMLEIGLTPNRPDCLSVVGIAREVAALTGRPLKFPDIHLSQTSPHIREWTSVAIEAPDLCPRYAARLLVDVVIGPSPFWLQDRLRSVELKPINNVVDVTNFVMMELGQPLHAFDFDHLAQHRIVVRTAGLQKMFTTLDGKDRRLSPDTLMICDGEKPVAVAGVMGGLNSEIKAATTRVLLESACFQPASIRKTAKLLGLGTDASHRFERGVDPEGTVTALNRAAQLIAEISGGRLVDGVIDEHPGKTVQSPIRLSVTDTNRRLGTALDQAEIARCLASVAFAVKATDAETLMVVPPSFRVDVSRPEDLMEEAARLWGYNRIPTTFPTITLATRPGSPAIAFKNAIRDRMAGYGFSESITYSFIAKNACDHLNLPETDNRRNLLPVLNPISDDLAVMRSSLMPGLLGAMRHNITRQTKNLKLFELGKIFISQGQDRQPQETEMLAGLWTGDRDTPWWRASADAVDFYDLKGVVEDLLEGLGLPDVAFSSASGESCHYTRPGHTASIRCGGKEIGVLGELAPFVISAHDLRQPAVVFECNLDVMLPLATVQRRFSAIPRFPATDRDMTVIVDAALPVGDILGKLKQLQEEMAEQWMADAAVLGVYAGAPIPQGKKSVSFRINYRSLTETLLDHQVNAAHKRITESIVREFKAGLPA